MDRPTPQGPVRIRSQTAPPSPCAILSASRLALSAARAARRRAARVVVEERYTQIFKLDRIRPTVIAHGLAEMQVRWPRRADRVLRDPQKSARDVVVRHQYGRRIYETR